MNQIKPFKSYIEQIGLLRERGMSVEDTNQAQHVLRNLNYYRLSGYWFPMRQFDESGKPLDTFDTRASFQLVTALYDFDERLRHCTFHELDRIEMAIRAMLGHELGRIDPLIHLDEMSMGPQARVLNRAGDTMHYAWLHKFKASMRKGAREDFVAHHSAKYGGEMPIWVAVEIMDWGQLSYLFKIAPNEVRNRVAAQCDLNAPQLESWLKSLNIVRNYAAHHARMFNRSYDLRPKLPNDNLVRPLAGSMNRVFGQLSLVQYLHRKLNLSPAVRLPLLFHTYPHNEIVPFYRTGAPVDWVDSDLWKC